MHADTARPTLFVTNWSSKRLHGPGRKWTIMAKPRAWEHGDGRIDALTPRAEDLTDTRAGRITVDEYHRRYLEEVLATLLAQAETWGVPSHLSPGTGMTQALELRTGRMIDVADGDTLCCACSREAAARGECHRVWAARLLADAGWRVILDGAEVLP